MLRKNRKFLARLEQVIFFVFLFFLAELRKAPTKYNAILAAAPFGPDPQERPRYIRLRLQRSKTINVPIQVILGTMKVGQDKPRAIFVLRQL